MFEDYFARFHFIVIEDIIYERKQMVSRKLKGFYILHLIFTRISLEKKICDPDNFIKRSSDLMTHSRHEQLLRLCSLLSFLAGKYYVVEHHSPLKGYRNLICNKIHYIKVFLRKLILVVIILQTHYSYSIIFHFQRDPHPDFTWCTYKVYIS